MGRLSLLSPGSSDLLMIVSLRPGPALAAQLLTSSRHPLRSGDTVVRPGGVWAPLARPFRTVISGSGGSLGIAPGQLCRDPGPLLLGRSGPSDRRPEGAGRPGGLTYLSRSAETYPLSDVRGISVGTRRYLPRRAVPGEQRRGEDTRRLGPAYIHTFSFIELLNRGRHSALWKWRPSAP